MAGALRDDWDNVPDDELEETLLERIEGLKEMFPEKLRKKVSSTAEWSWWLVKGTASLTRSAVWVISTTSLIMLVPYFVEKEIIDSEKDQATSQQQLLLGPSMAAVAQNK